MTDTRPSEKPLDLSEDRIPFEGIEATISDLVELYGGEITAEQLHQEIGRAHV